MQEFKACPILTCWNHLSNPTHTPFIGIRSLIFLFCSGSRRRDDRTNKNSSAYGQGSCEGEISEEAPGWRGGSHSGGDRPLRPESARPAHVTGLTGIVEGDRIFVIALIR